MRVFAVAVSVAGALGVASAAPVHAKVDPVCMANARAVRTDCVAQCTSDFVAQKFICRGRSPSCGVACLAGRKTCMDNVRTILHTGVFPDTSTLVNCTGGTDACDAALATAKQTCGAPCQPTDATCTDCVDAAQIANFSCRDACRDSWRTNPTVRNMLQSCKASFTSCVQACPPIP